MDSYKTISEYIARFPPETRELLEEVRVRILKLIPGAEEAISYGIATFKLNGTYVIYLAGYRKHVSIYPAPRNAPAFKKELTAYRGGKGTVQFPLDKPIPFGLIARIVKFRLRENQERAKARKALKRPAGKSTKH